MQEGIQRGAHNPDKGMDTRKFLLIVLAFLLVALIGIFVWSRYSAATGKPTVNEQPGLSGDGRTASQKGGK